MGVKSDEWIVRMATQHRMIEPFQSQQVSKGRISSGVSSYGYDMRLARTFKVFRGSPDQVVDPKGEHSSLFEEFQARTCLLPPGSFLLGQSLEYFRIPRDVLTLCSGKSTYARCGVVVNVTPFEPEWEGYVTLSISNTGPSPVRVYAEEGIAQVIFLAAESVCKTSYADRKGQYQRQEEIVHARVKDAGQQA